MEEIREYLLNNEDKLLEVAQGLNNWDGSLEHLEFCKNDTFTEKETIQELKDNIDDIIETLEYSSSGIDDKLKELITEQKEEHSLEELIKGAVEKTEDQPIKNNPVKEIER
jgi:hypothetical protein